MQDFRYNNIYCQYVASHLVITGGSSTENKIRFSYFFVFFFVSIQFFPFVLFCQEWGGFSNFRQNFKVKLKLVQVECPFPSMTDIILGQSNMYYYLSGRERCCNETG